MTDGHSGDFATRAIIEVDRLADEVKDLWTERDRLAAEAQSWRTVAGQRQGLIDQLKAEKAQLRFEAERTQDIIAEFRKRDESATRVIEQQKAEIERLQALQRDDQDTARAALAATMAEADLSTYGGRFQDLPGEIQERLIRQKMGDATAAVAYLREHLALHAEELGMTRESRLRLRGDGHWSEDFRHVTDWSRDDHP